jgi:2-desacetyl-2-hydroxyethyl bacteriochlorophyllide A dehydrogenase
LGHELVGKVVAVGDGVINLKVGDRVVANPNDYCGVCVYCQKNLPNLCQNIIPMGIEADGGFANYVKLTEKVAHKIADDLKPEIAAFAEPLACLINGMDKIQIDPSTTALVMGAGVIGLLFVQMLKAHGANTVIVTEPVELRREYAKKCGADYVIDPTKEDVQKFVLDKTGIGVDYAIDVVGTQLKTGIDAVRKGGKVLLFGINAKAKPEIPQGDITNKEVAVLGTWLANTSFPRAVKVLESGVLNVEQLITHTFPLDKVEEGIEILGRGEGIEVLIDLRK